MLQNVFRSIYSKLQLHFYMQVFSVFEHREATLTTVEFFSMEAINALGRPTAARFAKAMGISAPNAAYRISSLIKKGYLRKVRSTKDLRSYFLEPTEKYEHYNSINEDYLRRLDDLIKEQFSQEDYDKLTEMLSVVDQAILNDLEKPSHNGKTPD
ncbi:DNA-binding transcriptional regulator, MarR family [Lachnospiraceae bacterium C10]|nr:MarR family transcriptional regulator [Lachnospiraceae bacterium]SCW53190.1 DNA-binding transcriptional regulator, MarR family [Lachnospiraceae bacterium C10]SDW41570.1 DNA-binding transcriptional regulator, MarR family [Lachnospiraceae bacterium KHCPX20]